MAPGWEEQVGTGLHPGHQFSNSQILDQWLTKMELGMYEIAINKAWIYLFKAWRLKKSYKISRKNTFLKSFIHSWSIMTKKYQPGDACPNPSCGYAHADTQLSKNIIPSAEHTKLLTGRG